MGIITKTILLTSVLFVLTASVRAQDISADRSLEFYMDRASDSAKVNVVSSYQDLNYIFENADP
jgi:hypothetical protein